MTAFNIHTLTANLRLARRDTRFAHAEAMRIGAHATQPLSVNRLRELCVLGEKMMHAERLELEAGRLLTEATHQP
jgi:hypothetical protein